MSHWQMVSNLPNWGGRTGADLFVQNFRTWFHFINREKLHG